MRVSGFIFLDFDVIKDSDGSRDGGEDRSLGVEIVKEWDVD